MKKIYLGGTCSNSKWRDEFIKLIDKEKFECINPVVDNWKYSTKLLEERINIMNDNDILLYVISPKQKGFTSIASMIDYSNKIPNKLIVCILLNYEQETFEGYMLESIKYVKGILELNNVKMFDSLEAVSRYLNSKKRRYKDEFKKRV